MPSNTQVFSECLRRMIESHASEYNMIPVFSRETSEITDFLYYEEFVSNTDDAYEIIEKELETFSSDIPRILLGDWYVDYHFLQERWIFRKHLEFEDVLHDSRARESTIKRTLADNIRGLSPGAFELLLNEIFSELEQYEEPQQRPQARDGGYEMVVRCLDRVTNSFDWILVQAKHQQGRVSVSQVRELIGTLNRESNLHRDRRYRGLMVSIHPATEQARKDAAESSTNIDFLDLDDLVELMYTDKIGWISRDLPFATADLLFWSRLGGEDE